MSDVATANGSGEGARVDWRIVLATIVAFWLFYFAMVTLRSSVVDTGWRVMVAPRAIVAAAGMIVTAMMWLVLRRFDRRPIGFRIAAVMLFAAPTALASAAINYGVFRQVDKSMLDDGNVMLVIDRNGQVILDTAAGIEPEHNTFEKLVKELSDIAIGRYFLLVAWGALYSALGYAAQVGAAERRAAEYSRAAKAAELRSLRYQVNPHFLFNTLNSLSALVMTGRREDAETMIQTLSTFYRTSLTADPTIDVRLSDEIGFQQLYLDIEAVRFPARLRVAIVLPEDLADLCVPGLILQPLVENAVKHGVAATSESVTIRIVARQRGEVLLVTVADNGRSEAPPANGTSIGLANVRDRLAARYGDDASLEIARPLSGGFEATLHLPLVRDGC